MLEDTDPHIMEDYIKDILDAELGLNGTQCLGKTE